MHEEQERWKKQWYSNLGDREFLRLSCAILAWIVIGAVVSVATRSDNVLGIFLIAGFFFVAIGPRWRPGYAFMRKILGNKDLPAEPYPGKVRWFPSERRPWWSYIPGLWGFLMMLIMFYLAYKYFSK